MCLASPLCVLHLIYGSCISSVSHVTGSISNIDDSGTYRCKDGSSPSVKQQVISGVLGAASSVTSIQVANLLRLFRIPQVSAQSCRECKARAILTLRLVRVLVISLAGNLSELSEFHPITAAVPFRALPLVLPTDTRQYFPLAIPRVHCLLFVRHWSDTQQLESIFCRSFC